MHELRNFDEKQALADSLFKAGKVDASIATQEDARTYALTSFGKDSKQYAIASMNLGFFIGRSDDREGAEDAYLTAVKSFEAVHGKNSEGAIWSRFSLVLHYIGGREYVKAYQQVLIVDSNKTELTEQSRAMLPGVIANVGAGLALTSDFKRSDVLYQKAMQYESELDSVGLRDLTIILDRTGRMLFERGDLDTAEKVLMQSVQLARSIGPFANLNQAISLNQLARLHGQRNEWIQATNSAQAASPLFAQAEGRASNHWVMNQYDLGGYCYENKQYDRAVKHLDSALPAAKKVHGESSREVLLCVEALIMNLNMAEQVDRELELYAEYVDQFRTFYGPDNTRYAMFISNYGVKLSQRERFSEAKKYWIESLAILDKQTEDVTHLKKLVLGSLNAVSRQQGLDEDAKKYQKRLDELE